MNSVQLQTRHGRQAWWLTAGLIFVGGLVAASFRLATGDTSSAIAWLVTFAAGSLLFAGFVPPLQRKTGLLIGRTGLSAVGVFSQRPAPPGARANTALNTREEGPGVWLTLPNAKGKAKLVQGMLHVPSGAIFSFLFRSPNELLVRDAQALDPAAREWRGTGVFWDDDNDAALVQYIGQWLDGPAAGVPQQYVGASGPAAYAMSAGARLRLPSFPGVLIPMPFVILVLVMIGGSTESAWTLLVVPAIIVALMAMLRMHQREVVIESQGFRVRGVFGTKLVGMRGPQLIVTPAGKDGAAISAAAPGGKPKRLGPLTSHHKANANNALLVRYPRATDPNLRHWRPTGVTWADGGQHVAWYLQQAVAIAQTPPVPQYHPGYAAPQQFAHVPQ